VHEKGADLLLYEHDVLAVIIGIPELVRLEILPDICWAPMVHVHEHEVKFESGRTE
jgi:hypothetical protein